MTLSWGCTYFRVRGCTGGYNIWSAFVSSLCVISLQLLPEALLHTLTEEYCFTDNFCLWCFTSHKDSFVVDDESIPRTSVFRLICSELLFFSCKRRERKMVVLYGVSVTERSVVWAGEMPFVPVKHGLDQKE